MLRQNALEGSLERSGTIRRVWRIERERPRDESLCTTLETPL